MGHHAGLQMEPADDAREKGVQLRSRERHDRQAAGGSAAADRREIRRPLPGREAGGDRLRYEPGHLPVRGEQQHQHQRQADAGQPRHEGKNHRQG